MKQKRTKQSKSQSTGQKARHTPSTPTTDTSTSPKRTDTRTPGQQGTGPAFLRPVAIRLKPKGFLLGMLVGLMIGAVIYGLIFLWALDAWAMIASIGTTPDPAAWTQAWMSVIQTALNGLTLTVSALLTYALYLGTKEFAKFQFLRSNYDAWKDLDLFLLSNPDALKSLHDITAAPGSLYDETSATQKHLSFLLLNPYYSYYYAIQAGLLSDEMRTKFDKNVKALLVNEPLFRLTQESVFVEGFAEYCDQLRNSGQSVAEGGGQPPLPTTPSSQTPS